MIRQRCGDPYLHNAALETENQVAQMKLILSEQFAGKSLLMVN
ncbi:hypothetical protein T03_13789 [Trichinella britovi]|uniref:Uncharacterized protein n=1 Tax=Trichinella britovi TaxID=45882 RepID=A0A0V0ZYM5_TRIBR|nr:hypothetical protein T03_13789 [Trichinella britovi]